MKKLLLAILVSVAVLPLFAQGRSGLQVGLNLGTNMRFGKDVSLRPGFDGALDLRYVFLSPMGYSSQVGLQVGVGLGYMTSFQRSSIASQTDVAASSVSGGTPVVVPIRYTVSADADYQDKQWELTIPLMLSFRFGAFALDLGPRFAIGISPTYSLTLRNGSVDAYLMDYDVHITDDRSIGFIPSDGLSYGGSVSGTPFALYGVAALGYEWRLGQKGAPVSRYNSPHALESTYRTVTLQFVAEYPFWQSAQAAMPNVSLSATAFPAPQVSLPALGKPVCLGVRVAYTIFPGTDKRYRCYCFR